MKAGWIIWILRRKEFTRFNWTSAILSFKKCFLDEIRFTCLHYFCHLIQIMWWFIWGLQSAIRKKMAPRVVFWVILLTGFHSTNTDRILMPLCKVFFWRLIIGSPSDVASQAIIKQYSWIKTMGYICKGQLFTSLFYSVFSTNEICQQTKKFSDCLQELGYLSQMWHLWSSLTCDQVDKIPQATSG